MITAKEFQSKFISIIDQNIGKDTKAWKKSDGSLVTNIDLIIEKELYFLIKENFHDITIISEENVNTHKEEYILKNKFAIIDPIDGTENFNYLNNLYGCVISVVYDSFVYHGIYIPEQKNIISNLNIKDQNISLSNIILFSEIPNLFAIIIATSLIEYSLSLTAISGTSLFQLSIAHNII
jgi:3'-phosphoadenosine 5'-phosphosulfate (PAPS) 3'-phosphatase